MCKCKKKRTQHWFTRVTAQTTYCLFRNVTEESLIRQWVHHLSFYYTANNMDFFLHKIKFPLTWTIVTILHGNSDFPTTFCTNQSILNTFMVLHDFFHASVPLPWTQDSDVQVNKTLLLSTGSQQRICKMIPWRREEDIYD